MPRWVGRATRTGPTVRTKVGDVEACMWDGVCVCRKWWLQGRMVKGRLVVTDVWCNK